jgi:hypothetical protein
MHGSTLIFHSSDSDKSYSLTQKYGSTYSALGTAAQERFSLLLPIRDFQLIIPLSVCFAKGTLSFIAFLIQLASVYHGSKETVNKAGKAVLPGYTI